MGAYPVFISYFLTVEKDSDTGWLHVCTTDAAAVLAYTPELDSVVLVSQNRPAIGSSILESVAGRIDRDASAREIMVSELLEEAGIVVDPADIELINFGKPLASSPGFATEKKYLGYVEVKTTQIADLESDDVVYGIEEDRERIKRVLVKVDDLKNMEFESMSLFALVQWFLNNKHLKRKETE